MSSVHRVLKVIGYTLLEVRERGGFESIGHQVPRELLVAFHPQQTKQKRALGEMRQWRTPFLLKQVQVG